MFLVGFQDSLDIDPYVWKGRDTVVLLYGLFFRFVVADGTSWWSWPFIWVRLLSIGGHRIGGRVGRIMVYAAWLAFCIWTRETQCMVLTPPGAAGGIQGNWVQGWLVPIGHGVMMVPGYMVGAVLGNFEMMHWLGLELGPFLRAMLQKNEFFTHLKGRPLIALAFLVALV